MPTLPTTSLICCWQKVQGDVWQLAHQDAHSTEQSMRSTFVRPCRFCGSKAQLGNSMSNHHATKCAPFFQIAAVRRLHRTGELQKHMYQQRGPALKQTEKPAQYKELEHMGIASLLLKGRGGPDGSTTGSSSLRLAPKRNAKTDEQHSRGSPSRYNVSENTQVQECDAAKVVLHNPHNSCYVNVSVLSLLRVMPANRCSAGLKQLRELLCRSQGRGLDSTWQTS